MSPPTPPAPGDGFEYIPLQDFASGDIGLPELHDQSGDEADHRQSLGRKNKSARDLLEDVESGDLALPELRYRHVGTSDHGETTAVEPQSGLENQDAREIAPLLGPAQRTPTRGFFRKFWRRADTEEPIQSDSSGLNEANTATITLTKRTFESVRSAVGRLYNRVVEAHRKATEYEDLDIDDETGIDRETGRLRRWSITANASPDLHPVGGMDSIPDDLELPPGLFIPDDDVDPEDTRIMQHIIFQALQEALHEDELREAGKTCFGLTPSELCDKIWGWLFYLLYVVFPVAFGCSCWFLILVEMGLTPLRPFFRSKPEL